LNFWQKFLVKLKIMAEKLLNAIITKEKQLKINVMMEKPMKINVMGGETTEDYHDDGEIIEG
jgi:hypothetical protein